MKKYFVLAFCMFYTVVLSAQVQDPVKWIFSKKKIDARTYEIHLTATIDDGWHTYSQSTPAGGPIPTTIEFVKNPLLTLQGEAKEMGKLEKHFEPLFNVEVKQFSEKVDFVQKVVLKANIKTTISGSIKFMTCNDQECMPPASQKFSITLR